MEIDHDLDLVAHGFAQRPAQPLDMGHHGGRCGLVQVGDEDDFQGPVAALEDGLRLFHHRGWIECLVDRCHVAQPEVGVELHPIPYLAAQKPPHRQPDRLAEDVPQRVLDAADRGHADDAEAVVAVLLEHAADLLDVPGIAAEEQWLQVLDRAGDGARLPVQRRFTPAVETVLVRLHLHEDPVAHLRIHHQGSNVRDLHRRSPLPTGASGPDCPRGGASPESHMVTF
jgi:hypothetical protein